MKNFIAILVVGFILLGCVKNNPDPAWLEISEWTLIDNPSETEGELTLNFKDAWVYVNNDLLGVFELPCKVPVLESGNANIKIFPTVRNNGIAATKKIYPFVNYFEITGELSGNDIFHIDPVTSYKSGLTFWIEDFEGPLKMQDDLNSQTSLIVVTEPGNTNNYGRVYLNESATYWAAYTNEELALPVGQEVYLEVDYRVTNNLVTGLIAIDGQGATENHVNIRMNAQDPSEAVWKKIYIDLKELVSNTGGVGFLQSFEATLDEGDSEGEILIDNIKVIHF